MATILQLYESRARDCWTRRSVSDSGVRVGTCARTPTYPRWILGSPSGTPRHSCLLFVNECGWIFSYASVCPLADASSLAKKCMAVYQTFVSGMNQRIQKQIAINNPFVFKHVSNLKARAIFMAYFRKIFYNYIFNYQNYITVNSYLSKLYKWMTSYARNSNFIAKRDTDTCCFDGLDNALFLITTDLLSRTRLNKRLVSYRLLYYGINPLAEHRSLWRRGSVRGVGESWNAPERAESRTVRGLVSRLEERLHYRRLLRRRHFGEGI